MFFKGLVLALLLHLCFAGMPEQGFWKDVKLQKSAIVPGGFISGFSKVSFNDTKISLKLNCESTSELNVTVRWLLRYSECAEEYDYQTEGLFESYLDKPEGLYFSNFKYEEVYFANFTSENILCDNHMVLPFQDGPFYKRKAVADDTSTDEDSKKDTTPEDNKTTKDTKENSDKDNKKTPGEPEKKTPPQPPEEEKKKTAKTPPKEQKDKKVIDNQTGKATKKPTRRRKRAAASAEEKDAKKPVEASSAKVAKQPAKTNPVKKCTENNVVYKTWRGGNYLFVVLVTPVATKESTDKDKKSAEITSVTATVEMYYGPCEDKQYISAIDWPLLPFYGVLCALYALYAVGWLLMLACFWRDLLRIQFWIGGVIFLGMCEKAMYEEEYRSIDQYGQSVKGLIIFAELTSCLKRALARMLVVIVSVGFGIVKPRLGPTLHKVVGVGGLYFILSAIEACIRVTRPKYDESKQAMLAIIPLAVLEFAIAWWTFSSLLQTTRTLRLRRNIVKLSLYRHFTNTLIFAVIASVAFMIWFIKIKFEEGTCMRDWNEKWLDDGYWHLLFAIILLIIIILWRPSQNNQRYAFSPLLDAAEEDDEPVMNDAFEGMKMRGTKHVNSAKDPQNKVEEDLKWIEENIPASMADTALPSLLDSDEEIETTKFEMSKMD